jgi:hypothetical protein
VDIQTALTIAAALLGFGASLFFALGAVRLSNSAIFTIARPRWDFHPDVAKNLATQKSDYTFGSCLLLLAFVSQVLALMPLPFTRLVLFPHFYTGLCVLTLIFLASWAVCYFSSRVMVRSSMVAIDALDQTAQREEQEAIEQQKRARGT